MPPAATVTRERISANQTARAIRPRKTSVPFWKGVNRARTSGPNAIQVVRTSATSITPRAVPTMRAPKGRHVCGSSAGLALIAISQTAGVDVGEQDRPRAELVEVVHQLLSAVAGDHRAHRHPAFAMQR